MRERLAVVYENKRVGQLVRSQELTYSFTYDESWLRGSQSFALSLALPLAKLPRHCRWRAARDEVCYYTLARGTGT